MTKPKHHMPGNRIGDHLRDETLIEENNRRYMYLQFKEGVSKKFLSKKYKCSWHTISRIINQQKELEQRENEETNERYRKAGRDLSRIEMKNFYPNLDCMIYKK